MMTLTRCTRVGTAALAVALALAWGAVAVAGGGPPPTIDDLDGTAWDVSFSGAEYDLNTGLRMTLKGATVWLITKIDDTTVNIHDVNEGTDTKGYYDAGLLVVGQVDDGALATEAVCAYLIVSGTPGKLKLKGEFISYDVMSGGELEAGRIGGRQQTM